MILAGPEGELGLQEQLVTTDDPRPQCRLNRLTDGRLVVMSALVGGVDPAEPMAQGLLGQRLGVGLLPGSPVDQPWKIDVFNGEVAVGHAVMVREELDGINKINRISKT